MLCTMFRDVLQKYQNHLYTTAIILIRFMIDIHIALIG